MTGSAWRLARALVFATTWTTTVLKTVAMAMRDDQDVTEGG